MARTKYQVNISRCYRVKVWMGCLHFSANVLTHKIAPHSGRLHKWLRYEKRVPQTIRQIFDLCYRPVTSCMLGVKFTCNLSTLWLTETQMKHVDSFHYRCLRSIANIPTAWGAMQIGVARTSNEQVRETLRETLLGDDIRLH